MDLHFTIELSIVAFAILIGMALQSFISKRGVPMFESSNDRDGTIMMFLLFISAFYTMALFSAMISDTMVAQIIGGIWGSIGTATAFVYKDKSDKMSSGNGNKPDKPKD